MEPAKEKDDNKQQRRSFFELLTEVFGWLQIVASPLIAGLVIGLMIYLSTPGQLGALLGIATAFAGLVAGVIWATRVWKKKGTVPFLSGVMATPELDKKPKSKITAHTN